MLILDDSFRGVVQNSWPKNSPSIQNNLHLFKECLIEWNNTTFGNVYRKKRHCLARFIGVQNYLQSNPMSRLHQKLEADLQVDQYP